MCRLLGIYGKVDFWQKIALEFSKLAECGNISPVADEPGHKDGWGMAKSNDGKTAMVEITRKLGSAYEANPIVALGDYPCSLLPWFQMTPPLYLKSPLTEACRRWRHG